MSTDNKQQPMQRNTKADNASDDVIDLGTLIGTLIDRKLLIVLLTTLFALAGIVVALFSTPIYNATAMIQVENSGSSVPGLDEMAGMFESSSKSVTEIELLKSRSVIGEAVDALNLDVVATPKLYPYIGGRSLRRYRPAEAGDISEPRFGASSYAWGGEQIKVFRFDVPKQSIGKSYIVKAEANKRFKLLTENGEIILQGKVGEEATNGSVTLTIKTLLARAGTEFMVSRRSRFNTILSLQGGIGASEKGKDSGIINLNFQHPDPEYAKKVLNAVAEIYVKRNVERNSAEAQKSLDFLRVQLPKIKTDLEKSEALFNEFQMAENSVNISLETQAVLEQVVNFETSLQNVELQRLEISLKLKPQHPDYQAVLSKIESIEQEIAKLNLEIRALPEIQQELLGLMRDVEVGNTIYMLLLAKTQELDIVRAGTVGNVRIIDVAEVNIASPVKPKKSLIITMTTLLGGMLAVAIVLIQKALNKGVENPSDIEAIGLPVYASVPYSLLQDKLDKLVKVKKAKEKDSPNISHKIMKKGTEKSHLLAIDNPADQTIEALRNLRTSLHFAMIEAENNLLVISGPSPEVGKSFISANLAVILAESGKKVLLIDGDMRRGYLHKLMALKPEQGLSEYLSGQGSLESVIKSTAVADFDMITRGSIPPNPSELLMHKNFSHLNDAVRARYDIVIIDTPPVLAVTDAAIIAGYGGTLLLVTRYGQNTLKEIAYTRQRLEQNGIDVKGVVFNGIMKKASNTYGYYGNYGYYNYEYKSDK
ncbi:MAG: tyrosine-protein kinase Etk/Wzc [Cognaticolwellia sp.]|jgi:tyrosine-protein kinase Etk/Wzc